MSHGCAAGAVPLASFRRLASQADKDPSTDDTGAKGRLRASVPRAGVFQATVSIHRRGDFPPGRDQMATLRFHEPQASGGRGGKRTKTTSHMPMMLAFLEWTFRDRPRSVRGVY